MNHWNSSSCWDSFWEDWLNSPICYSEKSQSRVQPTQETLRANWSSTQDGSYTETNEYCRNLECRIGLVWLSNIFGICGMASMSNHA